VQQGRNEFVIGVEQAAFGGCAFSSKVDDFDFNVTQPFRHRAMKQDMKVR
jgi:hypothetical protein